jgi:hypothetical protein
MLGISRQNLGDTPTPLLPSADVVFNQLPN